MLLVAVGCRSHAPRVDASAAPTDASLDATGESDALDAGDGDADAAPKLELPRGGREIFPTYRLVGFCGTPGAPALGRLLGNLGTRSKEIEKLADQYAKDRTTLPVFELIAVVTTGLPGLDGKSRRRVPDKTVDDYLQSARDARALLLLNIQPGRSDFLTEVKHFESYFKNPDVGLALDPEWAMSPTSKEAPGKVFGFMSTATLNEVADYLSGIVRENDLPQKVLVFHQVNQWVFKNDSEVTEHDGVVIIKSVDGLGPAGTKVKTYGAMVKGMPAFIHPGFKLFFDEDTAGGHRLMKPDEVLALTPEPEYVMYE